MIFIKPLPEYLLSFEFWDKHLGADTDIRKSACGLLLSYALDRCLPQRLKDCSRNSPASEVS